jgi:hypothetical protein
VQGIAEPHASLEQVQVDRSGECGRACVAGIRDVDGEIDYRPARIR